MKDYIKDHLWEYLMCVIMTVGAAVNIFPGFYIPEEAAQGFLRIGLLAAFVHLVFYLGAYHKVTVIVSGFVYAALVTAVFLGMRARGVKIVDSPDSDTVMYIYYFALVITAALVFTLSRFRVGIVFLFLLGISVIAAMDFLDFDACLWGMALFLLGCLVIYVLRQYRHSALHSSTLTPNFFSCFLAGLTLALMALILSAGVYFAVIRPFNLPVLDIKLITKYMKLEILDKTGISQQYAQIDPELSSSLRDDRTLTAAQEGETPDEQPQKKNPDAGSSLDPEGDAGLETGSGPVERTLVRQSISYDPDRLKAVYLSLIILAALLLMPGIKRYYRRHWFRRLLEKDREEQICALYRYFLTKLRRLGYSRHPEETPYEFSRRCREKLAYFTADSANIVSLTDTFVRVRYGAAAVGEDEYQDYLRFYRNFSSNCRRQVGTARYLRKYLWL